VLLVSSVFIFHNGFGLGWPGTAVAILCAFGGAFVVWLAAWRWSRSGPHEYSADSRRGRFLLWAAQRAARRAR